MSIIKGSNVILTGGDGFLGKVLSKKIEERGCKELFVPKIQDYDLTKIEDVKRLFDFFKADIVIHAAADVGGIMYNKNNPAKIYYNNIMMNTLVMDAAYKSGVKKFTGIGTVCSYPKFAPIPFMETGLWEGYPEETNAFYGLAKKMMAEQSKAYNLQYGFNSIHLLMINLYGPGDNFDLTNSHVIPALVRKFCDAKKDGIDCVELWGDGSPSREFLYVEDASDAIVLATETLNTYEPVNIGNGAEIKIKDLAEIISRLVRYNGKIKWDTSKPNGQPRRCLDVSKAHKLFGFKAATSFEDGLEKTIKWYFDQNK